MNNVLNLLILLLTPAIVFAEAGSILNKNSRLIGEKEMFMANTGIGGIESAGAVYFNPAAMTQIKDKTFSASGNTYLAYTVEFDPIFVIDGTNQRYEVTGYNSIPSSIISVKTWKNYKVGYSIIVPYAITLESKAAFAPSPTQQLVTQINQRVVENEMWVGTSIARDLDFDKLPGKSSFGISIYGIWHSENQSITASIYTPGSTVVNQVNQRASQDYYGLIAIAGFLNEVNSNFRWGARLQTPSIKINASASYYQYNYQATGTGVVESADNVDQDGLSTSYDIPLDAGVGFVYDITKSVELAFDVSYQHKTKFNIYEEINTTSGKIETQGQTRFNLGIRIHSNDNTEYFLGLLYTPSVNIINNVNSGPHTDNYGISIGTKFLYGKFFTGIGFNMLFGSGDQPYLTEGANAKLLHGKNSFSANSLLLTSGYNF